MYIQKESFNIYYYRYRYVNIKLGFRGIKSRTRTHRRRRRRRRRRRFHYFAFFVSLFSPSPLASCSFVSASTQSPCRACEISKSLSLHWLLIVHTTLSHSRKIEMWPKTRACVPTRASFFLVKSIPAPCTGLTRMRRGGSGRRVSNLHFPPLLAVGSSSNMYINERVTFPSFSMMRKKTLASIRWYLLRIALSLFLSLSIKKRVVKSDSCKVRIFLYSYYRVKNSF